MVFGIFRIKSLIFSLLLASPALAAWAYLETDSIVPREVSPPSAEGAVQISVEVIAKGSAPQWVYVQVPPQAIPEPGFASLLALAGGILVLRRTRQPNNSAK